MHAYIHRLHTHKLARKMYYDTHSPVSSLIQTHAPVAPFLQNSTSTFLARMHAICALITPVLGESEQSQLYGKLLQGIRAWSARFRVPIY